MLDFETPLRKLRLERLPFLNKLTIDAFRRKRQSKKPKPFEGKVEIGQHSSLRKLMRAARRGKMPDDRQVIIDLAMERANES